MGHQLRDRIDTRPGTMSGEVSEEMLPMLPGFLERRQMEIIELQKLLDVLDFTGISFIGHRIKGTGAGFGFPFVSRMGARLEFAASQKDAVKVQDIIRSLHDFTETLKLSLKQ